MRLGQAVARSRGFKFRNPRSSPGTRLVSSGEKQRRHVATWSGVQCVEIPRNPQKRITTTGSPHLPGTQLCPEAK